MTTVRRSEDVNRLAEVWRKAVASSNNFCAIPFHPCGRIGHIARRSKLVARLVALREVKGRRQPGSMKGKLRVGPEFFEPLPKSELSRWE
jgi:hypothetical protein